MDMLRIAMLGVAGVFLALLLKSHKPEYSIFLSLSVGIVIFLYAMDKMAVMISYIRQLQSSLPIEGEYVGTILRMIGITYLAEFASISARMPDTGPLPPSWKFSRSWRFWR